MRGVLCILSFIVLMSLCTVYQAHLTQEINPTVFVLIIATIAMVFFGSIAYLQGGFSFLKKAKAYKGNIMYFNVANLIVFFCYMFALKYLEPAIVVIMANAIGPMLVILLSKYLRPTDKIFRGEHISAAGIILGLFFISAASLSGNSAVTALSPWLVALGIILTIVTGIGQISYNLQAKILAEAKFTSSEVLTLSYPLTVVVAALFVNKAELLQLVTQLPALIGILVICAGMVLGIYCFQIGISLTAPILVSILMLIEPVTTFASQFLDSRLKFSWYSYVGITLMSVFLVLSIASRLYGVRKYT